jgi:phage-related protein
MFASQVRNVANQVRNVASQVRNVASQVRNVASQVRNVASQVRNVASQVRNVASQVRNVAGNTNLRLLLARGTALSQALDSYPEIFAGDGLLTDSGGGIPRHPRRGGVAAVRL